MEFVAPLISTVNSVLGILFSKMGEKQKFGMMTYVFLIIAIFSGGLSLWGLYDARIVASEKTEQIKREKRSADSMRGLLLAKSFTERDAPVSAKLIVTLPSAPENGKPDEIFMYPLMGADILKSSIKFNVQDIIEFDYTVMPGRDVSTISSIEANFYDSGEKKCHLDLRRGSQEFEKRKSSECQTGSKFVYNAWLDEAPQTSLIIDLPKNEKFLKIFSRLEQQSRMFADGAGLISIETRNEGAAKSILSFISGIQVQVKFFQIYEKNRTGDCYSSLLVTYNLSLDRKGAQVVAAIKDIADYEMNLCEIVPI